MAELGGRPERTREVRRLSSESLLPVSPRGQPPLKKPVSVPCRGDPQTLVTSPPRQLGPPCVG